MSSPFSWFRRKQKVLLAVFGVLIIISFTVGGIVTQYQQQHMSSGGGTDAVLSWKHGKISETELMNMRYNHDVVFRFLERVVQETLARKGWPKAPGVRRDQSGRIVPGIPPAAQEEDLVRTMLMAQKATDMGIVVTEDAIWDFLYLLSDDKLDTSDFGSLLAATDDRYSRVRLFRQLRIELLAQNLDGIIGNGLMAIPPDRAWDYFNRFNRRVKAEALPINVADYEAKVEGEPTAEELQRLYEEGKDRYQDPESPEPGFKRRKKIAFQYLKVAYHDFLEREKEAVPMEDVAKYYEEHKDEFKVLELPPAEEEKPEAKPTVTPGKDDGSESPDTGTGADDGSSKDEKPSPGITDEAPKEEKPEVSPKSETAKPEKETSGPATKTDSSAPDVDLVPPKNEPADPGKPEASEGARGFGPEETLFVSFTAQPEPEDAEDAPAAAGESEGSAEAKPESEDTAPTEPDSKDGEDADKGKPDTEKPAEDTVDVAEEPEPKDDPTAEAVPAPAPKQEADTSDSVAPDKDPTGTDGDSTEAEKPIEYQPIEDVEDDIRQRIAEPIAEEQKNKALEAAQREVEVYFDERIRWEAMIKAKLEATEPPPLDHEALAERWNITAGETPRLDEIEIKDFELGRSYVFADRQTITFSQIAYMDNVPLFKPYKIPSSEWKVDFLFWKIEEEDWMSDEGEDESVPELDEIRDEVVDAWRRIEAFKLAKAEAESLAKKAKGDEPLEASLELDEEQAKEVVKTGEFSWMSGGATPTGMGRPMISPVFGIESPGKDFMKAVFALKPGETGVAVNQPQAIVYVVRVISEPRNEAQRRTEFMERRGGGIDAMYAHAATVYEVMQDWRKDLEKEMKLEWHRPQKVFGER